MSKHEQYDLVFTVERNAYDNIQPVAYSYSVHNDAIAKKLNAMHLGECKELITTIEAAQKGNDFEEYFWIDNTSATDDDTIQVFTTNVNIDQIIIPIEDIKQILQEWITHCKS